MRTALYLFVGFLILAQPVSGQVVADSLIGDRVRIRLSRQDRTVEGYVPRQQLRGTLIAVGQDSVAIRLHPETAAVRVAENGIYQIDVSRGISRARSALRLGVQGALTWAAIGAVADTDLGGGDFENTMIWAGGGLIVGTIFGAMFPEEHWTRVFRR